MPKIISHSEKETKKIAADFAKNIISGVIALSGKLGAGKTIFVQGFAKSLGIKEKVISPTFVLIRQHQIPKTKKTLFHIDLYRLENTQQFSSLGLEELFNDPNNIVLIEWAEKISKSLLRNTIKIKIEKEKGDTRLITVS